MTQLLRIDVRKVNPTDVTPMHRPMVCENNQAALGFMKDCLSEMTNNIMITAGTVGSYANHIFHQASTPSGQVGIYNGFNSERLSFEFVVRYNNLIGGGSTELHLTAFSNDTGGIYIGMDNKVHIAPETKIVIGSIVDYKDIGTGNSAIPIPSDSFYNQSPLLNNPHSYSIAPRDLAIGHVSKQFHQPNSKMVYGNAELRYAKPMASSVVTPAAMLAGMLEVHKQSNKAETTFGNNRMSNTNQTASNLLSGVTPNVSYAGNPFIMAITAMRDNSYNPTRGEFTWNDVISAFPYYDQVTYVHTEDEVLQFDHFDNIYGWGGTDYATSWAQQIVDAIPGIMLKFGVKTAGVVFTNRTMEIDPMTGKRMFISYACQNDAYGVMPGIVLSNPNTQAGWVDELKSKFINTVILTLLKPIVSAFDVSYGSYQVDDHDIMIDLRADVTGTTALWISVDGSPLRLYAHQSYAVTQGNPLVCDLNTFHAMNDGMSHILESTLPCFAPQFEISHHGHPTGVQINSDNYGQV